MIDDYSACDYRDTMLKKVPLMEEIANTAVFLASEFAKSIGGVTIDVTGGATAGLNYRVGSSAIKGFTPTSVQLRSSSRAR